MRLKWPLRLLLHYVVRGVLRARSRRLVFSPGSTILVIAPHPDDESFGCGGLIALKRRSGARVHVLYVTDGSGSHPRHPTLDPETLAQRRRGESTAAAAVLGVPPDALTYLDAKDGSLACIGEPAANSLVTRIADVFRSERPTEVFLPSRRDCSSEHEAVFRFMLRARQLARSDARVFEFPVWSWWNPRLLRPFRLRSVWRLTLGEAELLKRAAIACHRSQIEPSVPWTTSVLPAGFESLFATGVEYYFEE